MSPQPKKVTPGGVDEYIAACPIEVQGTLEDVRKAIKSVAPGCIETVSYFKFPGYCYEGYDYNGMFAWFSFKKPYVRLHVRPPVIQQHKNELSRYTATKAIVSFPTDELLPVELIKKLVSESLNLMKNK